MRYRFALPAALACALLVGVPVSAAPELTAVWDAASGGFPTQVCPSWTLSDTATPEDPVLSGGKLVISTSADSENMFHTMFLRDEVPDPLVVEARVRRVDGSTSWSGRAPVSIFVTQRASVGILVAIGADEVFLMDGSTRQATAIVDTDGAAHTYRIEITAAGAVTVRQDGTLILSGTVNTNPSDHGARPRVGWGEGSSYAHGTSEWFYVGHNATRFNCPPVARDVSISTDEDTPTLVPPNASDPEGDALTPQVLTAPVHGGAFVEPDGTLRYVPDPDYHGPDAFTYAVDDGVNLSGAATVTIAVAPINDAPVAVADAAATQQYRTVTIDVLANDTDVDGDSLTIVDVGAPAFGTAAVGYDGRITYEPGARFKDGDAFTYAITDGTATATARVTISTLGCGEDGVSPLDGSPVDGAASERIDRDVEPTLGDADPATAARLHDVNCTLVVPVERVLEG